MGDGERELMLQRARQTQDVQLNAACEGALEECEGCASVLLARCGAEWPQRRRQAGELGARHETTGACWVAALPGRPLRCRGSAG